MYFPAKQRIEEINDPDKLKKWNVVCFPSDFSVPGISLMRPS